MENLLKNIKNQMSYKVFIENHPAIILVIDSKTGDIMDANKAAERFYGYSKEEFLFKNINDINTYSKEDVYLEMEMAKKQKRNFFKFVHRLKNGHLKRVNVISYPIIYNEKEYLFSIISDSYDDEKTKIDIDVIDLINTSDDALCIVNSADISLGEIVYANNSLAKLMDIDSASMRHLTLSDLFSEIDMGNNFGRKYIGGTHTLNLNNQEKLSVQVNCIKIKNSGDIFSLLHIKPINYKVVSSIDIKDEFINNVNRKFNKLEGYVIGLEIYSNSSEKDYIDKYYNYIQSYFVSSLRLNMIKFHIGKEALKVLLFTPSSLFDITRMINEFLSRVEEDEKYQFYSKFCKFRIGVSNKGTIVKDQIKSLRDTLESFSDYQYNSVIYSTKNDAFFKSTKLKQDIPKAIINNEFVLHAQAIVNIDTKLVEGVEILIRWEHEEYGLVYPNDFIKYAEISGKIREIDLWVLAESLEFVKDNKLRVGDLKFHINLSARSFELQELYKLLSSYEEDVLKSVVLEITEQSNYEILNETFDIIKSTGVEFAIDDFGTGYSSFERIRSSGVKYIKIDRSLIKNIVKNTDDLIILQAILAMCESLQIEVIAEGVEEIDQLEFLDARKCNLIQGYLFDKPVALNRLFDRLEAVNLKAEKQIISELDNELLDKLFYNTGQIFIQSLNDEFGFKNPNVQFAMKLGISMDELLKIKFTDLLKKEEQKYFFDTVNNKNRIDGVISVTTKLHYKNNSFDVICAGELGKSGEIRMYIEFLDDQKGHENRLKGLSQSYVEAFYKAPVGMVVVSDDFKILRWNQAATDIFACDSSEALGQKLTKLVIEKGMEEELNKVFNNALVGGSHESVLTNIDCYGNELTCQWNVNLISERDSIKRTYICIIQDITKKIELEKERVKINNALNQTKSAIIMTDLEGNFTYVNNTFLKDTGYTRKEIMNKNTNILSSNEQSNDFYNDLWETINNRNIWRGEFRNKKKDGSLYWARASIYPVIENEQLQGFIAIQQDVSNEKDLLDANESLKLKLYEQDKIASLGLLTTGIMHEINNPLSYIQGNINYLLDEMDKIDKEEMISHESFKEAFKDISLGIKQIKEIAEGLKKYVFKDQTEIVETVNLVDVISDVLTISRNEYKYYANINFEYDEKYKYITLGFSSKLRQVIMNLVINSSHAISDKNLKTLGEIKIKLIIDDKLVNIIFSDNGIGMSEDTKANIFEPFFTTKKIGVGSGLGLSITKDIIENDHKGSISCESELGKGTSFIIKLPNLNA